MNLEITHICLVAGDYSVKLETLHLVPRSSISNSCQMPQEAIGLVLKTLLL